MSAYKKASDDEKKLREKLEVSKKELAADQKTIEEDEALLKVLQDRTKAAKLNLQVF